jgi:hypothetical protein
MIRMPVPAEFSPIIALLRLVVATTAAADRGYAGGDAALRGVFDRDRAGAVNDHLAGRGGYHDLLFAL